MAFSCLENNTCGGNTCCGVSVDKQGTELSLALDKGRYLLCGLVPANFLAPTAIFASETAFLLFFSQGRHVSQT